MKRNRLKGQPLLGTYRLITKTEFALVRHLGVKRTHYIGHDEHGINVYSKLKMPDGKPDFKPIFHTIIASEILKEFWDGE